MQFSKKLLAEIHIKLNKKGLNTLSEKEVIILLAEQNQESPELIAEQNRKPIRTQDEILKGIAEPRQTFVSMLQTQNEMRQKMYDARQVQEKRQRTQDKEIDKLICWAKWFIVASGAVTAGVWANLIWKIITKR